MNPQARRKVEQASSLLQKAARQYAEGRFKQAAGSYRRYLKTNPHDADVQHALAGTYFQLGELTRARHTLEQALEYDPGNDTYRSDLGALCLSLGDIAAAEQHLRKALLGAPDAAQVHYNLGVVLSEQARYSEAVEAFRQATVLEPLFVNAYHNLGVAFLHLGRLGEAQRVLERVVELQPDLAQGHAKLGEVYRRQNRWERAIEALRKAQTLAPKDTEVVIDLAEALRQSGDRQEALTMLEGALSGQPKSVPLTNALARVLRDYGNLERAEALLAESLRRNPKATESWLIYANLHRFSDADMTDIEAMQRQLQSSSVSRSDFLNLSFALAKAFDDRGDYLQAFEYLRSGNDLKRKSMRYDRDQHTAFVDRALRVFSSAFFENMRDLGTDQALPLFIIGMPRSGTTLTEQILAAHPNVYGAGELSYFSSVAGQLPDLLQVSTDYPRCCESLNEDLAQQIIQSYLALLRRHDASAQFVTDKMPGNYLHLGLIRLLFPQAPIIHCRRSPLDVCLSIYFQHFKEGHTYAYDLADIAQRYRQYWRLMNHWREVLPGPYLEIEYETLVADSEKQIRRLVEFCGLPWDAACLAFHKQQREVKTASTWQVRQPMYATSRARWRRYEQQLEPLRLLLSEIIEEYSGVVSE
jgi:tetratricopeptide (TPR) repeat protein